ncbi:MAG: hypothetical protein KIH01_06580 [Candidatus Freyarchaeota archaeon]|nr:hypothetical protein [Candidatus Jordarchaeia archaeon]
MSFGYETLIPPEELLAKASSHLRTVGFKVKTKGYIIEAVDGRDYSTAWCILFFLLGIIPFIIYWFTRKKNKLTFDASKPNFFL